MSKTYEILIADDHAKPVETYLRSVMHEHTNANFSFVTSPRECRDLMSKRQFDLVFLDIHFSPNQEKGTDLIPMIRASNPDAKVYMMSGDDANDTLLKCIRLGAVDFISKNGMELDQMVKRIKNAITSDEGDLNDIAEGKKIASEMGIVYSSPKMAKIFGQVAVARRNPNLHVLITGETGSGKEVIAKAINFKLSRPYVVMNSSTIVENLAESDLFGHTKGAFSGAVSDHDGKFKSADGGDLFLDEAGNLTLEIQKKLLRATQFKEITPVGSNKIINVDVRVIAATNSPLEEMAKAGTFREDLLQRLKGIWIELPSLKDRLEDVPLLLQHFLKKSSKPTLNIANTCLSLLSNYSWPGNIRELENLVNETVASCNGDELTLLHLPPHFKRKLTDDLNLCEKAKSLNSILIETPVDGSYEQAINVFSKTYITKRMEILGDNLSKRELARDLELARSTIDEYVKKYNLTFPGNA